MKQVIIRLVCEIHSQEQLDAESGQILKKQLTFIRISEIQNTLKLIQKHFLLFFRETFPELCLGDKKPKAETFHEN